jgi:MtfA peptidase
MDFDISPELAWFLAAVSAAVIAGLVFLMARRGLRSSRRRRLFRTPLSGEQLQILQDSVPLYRRLPENLQTALVGHIQVFLAEKRFEGCGGLEVNETIRLVIAAHACLLLLGRRRPEYYPSLVSILVYPHTYEVPPHGRQVFQERSYREGESWPHGEVVLAWRETMMTARDATDGRNLVLHEFAHQLDQHDGLSSGTPHARYAPAFQKWVEVFRRRFDEHQQAVEEGRRTLLHEYGATNPAEFFAVATETFFERPVELGNEMPDLYEQLATYYNLDPARWV